MILSILGFLLTCILSYWVIRSHREAINSRLELEEARRLARLVRGMLRIDEDIET